MPASTMTIGVEPFRVRIRSRMPDPPAPEDPDIDPEPTPAPEPRPTPPGEPYPPCRSGDCGPRERNEHMKKERLEELLFQALETERGGIQVYEHAVDARRTRT